MALIGRSVDMILYEVESASEDVTARSTGLNPCSVRVFSKLLNQFPAGKV